MENNVVDDVVERTASGCAELLAGHGLGVGVGPKRFPLGGFSALQKKNCTIGFLRTIRI